MGKLSERERLLVSDRYSEAADRCRQASEETKSNYGKQNFDNQAALLSLVSKAVLTPDMYMRWLRLKAVQQLTLDAYCIEEKLITTGIFEENLINEVNVIVIGLLMRAAVELLEYTGAGGKPI